MNLSTVLLSLVLAATPQSAPPTASPATATPATPTAAVNAPADAPAEVTPTQASITTALDGVRVIATRRADSVQVGEAATYEVSIHASGEGASADSIRSARIDRCEVLGSFDVLSIAQPERASDGDFRAQLVIMTLDAGTQMPDAITLHVQTTRGGAPFEVSGAIALPSITVASVVGAETKPDEFRDIHGVFDLRTLGDHAPLLIAASILAVALAVAVLLWIKRRNRLPALVPADVRALLEIAHLRSQALPVQGAYRPYYDELTRIIRAYVADRYSIPAHKQTSREFIRAAESHAEFPAAETTRMRELLRLADLVKFAHTTPARIECDEHLTLAREFVEHTRPRVDAPNSTTAAEAAS